MIQSRGKAEEEHRCFRNLFFIGLAEAFRGCSPLVFTAKLKAVNTKDVRFLKIAHFEKFLEIKNIYDLDKNFYGNSHCVNAFLASRYICFGQKLFPIFSVRR